MAWRFSSVLFRQLQGGNKCLKPGLSCHTLFPIDYIIWTVIEIILHLIKLSPPAQYCWPKIELKVYSMPTKFYNLKFIPNLNRGLCTAFFVFLLLPNTSHAYIDPGSGSVIMTVLLGLFATITYTLKKYFYKVKNLFKKKDTTKH
jgi:hypothetical protein